MMRMTFLLLLVFLAMPSASHAADPDPLHLAGSRVRLVAPDKGTAAGRLSLDGRKHAGTVVEMRGDTLLFTADGQSIPALVPTASLKELEVSRGDHSHVLAGMGLGLVTGALLGGVIANASQGSYRTEDSALAVAFGVLVGGGVGVAAGAVVGLTVWRTERWDSLRLPISIGFLPRAETIGLVVVFGNR